MDQNQSLYAKEVFDTVCRALDQRNWKYTRQDEKLLVNFIAGGEDIPMEFFILVEPAFSTVKLVSPMPVTFSEEKRMEGAIAVCAATYALNDGTFDYDINTGKTYFRIASSYLGIKIEPELIYYLIEFAMALVDEYNHKFLALAKGYIGIEAFLEGK